MRSNVTFLACGAMLAASLYLSAAPDPAAPAAAVSRPAAPAIDEAGINRLIGEVEKQQATLTEQQTAIDARLAAIAEDLRVARIYVSRGGQ